MPNQRHGPPLSNKPNYPPGISPADLQAINLRVDAIEKLVRESLDEKNQWNSMVRDWIGKKITIRFVDGSQETGKLRWMDRYTICLEDEFKEAVIVHKGAITLLRLARG